MLFPRLNIIYMLISRRVVYNLCVSIIANLKLSTCERIAARNQSRISMTQSRNHGSVYSIRDWHILSCVELTGCIQKYLSESYLIGSVTFL